MDHDSEPCAALRPQGGTRVSVGLYADAVFEDELITLATLASNSVVVRDVMSQEEDPSVVTSGAVWCGKLACVMRLVLQCCVYHLPRTLVFRYNHQVATWSE